MEANKILSADILDLVFEDRNKEYGAYELRKTYNKRIRLALIITATIALVALLGSVLAKTLAGNGNNQPKINEVTLEDIKQEEEKKVEPPPPPPPKPPPPPQVEMAKFTPPKIVKDEEVKEVIQENKELEEKKIDVVNQEGLKDEGIATPKEIDEGKQVIEEKKDDENKVFEKVEVEAAYPGGEGAWRKFLEKNLNPSTPVDNGAPEGQYTVWIQFIVDKEGNVSEVKPLTSNGYGMEAEAVRVLKKATKWVPAIQNGRNVKAYRKQPITFVVEAQ
jgi:protein TonB